MACGWQRDCQFYRRLGAAALLPASLVETMGLIILHLFSCCYLVRAEMELTGCSVTCFAVGQRIGIFFPTVMEKIVVYGKEDQIQS